MKARDKRKPCLRIYVDTDVYEWWVGYAAEGRQSPTAPIAEIVCRLVGQRDSISAIRAGALAGADGRNGAQVRAPAPRPPGAQMGADGRTCAQVRPDGAQMGAGSHPSSSSSKEEDDGWPSAPIGGADGRTCASEPGRVSEVAREVYRLYGTPHPTRRSSEIECEREVLYRAQVEREGGAGALYGGDVEALYAALVRGAKAAAAEHERMPERQRSQCRKAHRWIEHHGERSYIDAPKPSSANECRHGTAHGATRWGACSLCDTERVVREREREDAERRQRETGQRVGSGGFRRAAAPARSERGTPASGPAPVGGAVGELRRRVAPEGRERRDE